MREAEVGMGRAEMEMASRAPSWRRRRFPAMHPVPAVAGRNIRSVVVRGSEKVIGLKILTN